jgi:hypothetical protein
MAFSYTDDAIVSASPTGRHLSTVIRRPCVLMSGWDEHAEAICKVLNELSASSSIGRTIGTLSYRVELDCSQVKEELASLGPFAVCPEGEVANSLEWDLFYPTGVCHLGDKPQKGRRGKLIAVLTAQLASVEAELARAHEQLKAPVELNSERIAALASMKPGACLYMVGNTRQTIKRV